MRGLGFRGLGFRGLGCRGLGFIGFRAQALGFGPGPGLRLDTVGEYRIEDSLVKV